jgi:hypothetical protein
MLESSFIDQPAQECLKRGSATISVKRLSNAFHLEERFLPRAALVVR